MFRATDDEGILTPMPTHGTEGGADRRARAGVLTAVLSTVVASLFVTVAASQPAAAAPSSPSRFVPVAPCRLLDTRLSGGPVAAGGTVDVAVVVRCVRCPVGRRRRRADDHRRRPGGAGLRDRLADRIDQARGLGAQLPRRRDRGQLPAAADRHRRQGLAVHAGRQRPRRRRHGLLRAGRRARSRPAGSCRSRPTG